MPDAAHNRDPIIDGERFAVTGAASGIGGSNGNGPAAAAPGPELLRVEGLSKTFPGTKAL